MPPFLQNIITILEHFNFNYPWHLTYLPSNILILLQWGFDYLYLLSSISSLSSYFLFLFNVTQHAKIQTHIVWYQKGNNLYAPFSFQVYNGRTEKTNDYREDPSLDEFYNRKVKFCSFKRTNKVVDNCRGNDVLQAK